MALVIRRASDTFQIVRRIAEFVPRAHIEKDHGPGGLGRGMTSITGNQVGMKGCLGKAGRVGGNGVFRLPGHIRSNRSILVLVMTRDTGLYSQTIEIIPNGKDRRVALCNLMAEPFPSRFPDQAMAIGADQPGLYMGIMFRLM